MFDKLDDILMRLEEVLNQLSEPDVAADAALFRRADTTDYAEGAWDEGQKSIKVRR